MVYYVALSFVRVDGGLAPGEAVECPYEAAAIRRGQGMACNDANAGAVAFSRRGSPDLGDFEEAVILKTGGIDYCVFCFEDSAHAELFREKFNAEWFRWRRGRSWQCSEGSLSPHEITSREAGHG